MHRSLRAGMTAALLAGGIASLVAVGSTTSVTSPAGQTADPPPDQIVFGYDAATERAYVEYDGPARTLQGDNVDGNRVYVELNRRCTVTNLTEIGQLLLITAPAGETIQLYENGLGTAAGNARCRPADGRIADDSWLQFSPGRAIGGYVTFADARLNVEGKFDTSLSYSFDSGENWSSEPLSGPGGDSGNDANGDNYEKAITPGEPFVSLRVAPTPVEGTRTELAIDNGGDGSGVGPTVFTLGEVYEYTLVCYTNSSDGVYGVNTDGTVKGITETPAEPDWNFAAGDPDGTFDYPQSATLFRYQGDPGKPCDPIGANLNADDQTVAAGEASVLLEPSNDTAYLRVELVWVIPADEIDAIDSDALARKIDLDGDGIGGEGARYCEGFDGSDPFDPANPGNVVHPVDQIDVDGTLVDVDLRWCVVTDERTLTQIDVDGEAVDVVIQRMIWDGLGDPRFY